MSPSIGSSTHSHKHFRFIAALFIVLGLIAAASLAAHPQIPIPVTSSISKVRIPGSDNVQQAVYLGVGYRLVSDAQSGRIVAPETVVNPADKIFAPTVVPNDLSADLPAVPGSCAALTDKNVNQANSIDIPSRRGEYAVLDRIANCMVVSAESAIAVTGNSAARVDQKFSEFKLNQADSIEQWRTSVVNNTAAPNSRSFETFKDGQADQKYP